MSEQQVEVKQNLKTTPPIKEVIACLCDKFPSCFIAEGEAKPLKIGIFQDLSEALTSSENLSNSLIRQALRSYTKSWRYLHACREGAVRVGLDGQEAGVVDAQQAEHAQQTLANEKAAYAARRAQALKEQRLAQRQQQKEQAKKRAESRKSMPKASLESLAALESKFSKNR